MPPRVSRSSTARTNPRPKERKPASAVPLGKSAHKGNYKKSTKRALDAFAIASHEAPERVKIRRSRLGEIEGPAHSSRRKRAREEDEEDEDEEEEEGSKRQRRTVNESDEGSDSEGNEWTMGHVDSDDDEDIDSDEAFGESDEERFEGWVFRGSESTHGKKKKPSKGKKQRGGDEEEMDIDLNEGQDIDLDEGESGDAEEDDESDWGDEAIDLATALDQYEDSDAEEEREKKKKEKKEKKKAKKAAFDENDSEPSEQDDLGIDGAEDYSSSGFSSEDDEDEDEDEPENAARLKDLISSLPKDEEAPSKPARKADVHESGAPSEFGVMRKVDLLSFKPKITDPEKKKSLKLLQDDVKPTKRNDITRKLEAPLPKRQQDKLDRAVAAEKANETLGRWVDTVKQNRRAEHLSFPLKSVHASEPMGESRLQPTTTSAPANDLEAAIQSILQESGLSNGKDDEEQIQKWEELQTNKLPIEEVAKRRAMLRRERELLFREEVRAKRVKKIKSKAYRRVHRREREKLAEKEREQLKADGEYPSEDEKEYNDRRRAEERMGAKHRESKWAKGVKQSGRAAWDDDARAGVTEMARRNEELRRRIEGKAIRDEDDEGSDFTSDEEEEYDSDEDQGQVLLKQLGKLKENPFSTKDDSKIGNMLFMQRAEAAKKARNDATIEEMRRELAGEEENSSDEDDNAVRAGRKKFAPVSERAVPAIQVQRGEFEEAPGSDDDEGDRRANSNKANITRPTSSAGAVNPYLTKATKDKSSGKEPDALWKAQDTISALQESAKAKPKSKSKSKAKATSDDEADELPEPKVSAPDADGWQTVTYDQASEDDDGDASEADGVDLATVRRNQALTASAFAGDNIESEFASEKAAAIDDESTKTVTTHLPGWGAWTGDGLSANAKKNRGKKTVTKVDGVKASKRKDLRMEKVIISEKKVKKNSKFLATQLPFPFESREQYERSLRVPKGPEWTTKMVFQDATKPRVMVKQGVIKPMHKPLV